jgi:parallel beta-helix repeat protein
MINFNYFNKAFIMNKMKNKIFASLKLIIHMGLLTPRIVGVLVLFSTLFLTQIRAQYYVSPKGKDSNTGTSPDESFLTLARAQIAMESGPVKITYLMGGIYVQSGTVRPSGGTSWIAYPGQTPVIDGSESGRTGVFSIGTNKVTINGLTIKNAYIPIRISHADSVVIRNNTILNSRLPHYNGAISASAKVTHLLVSHNLIDGSNGRGISVDSGSDSTLANTSSDITIEYNLIYNTDLSGGEVFNDIGCDAGAIYFNDRPHASKNNTINNNIIKNYGTNSFGYPGCFNIVAIYIDDNQSNVTITNNIVYGTGEYGVLLHGSDNVTIRNNIFHLNGVINPKGKNQIGFYQSVRENYGMKGNVFTKNIIYSMSPSPASLWNFDPGRVSIAKPEVSNNLYFTTAGTLSNSGPIIDNSPLVADPLFLNPSNLEDTHYALRRNSPAIKKLGFVPIDIIQYGPQTGTKTR